MTILVLDVSHYQGKMNWDTAKAMGVRGAIIKATEGITWRDEMFKRNAEECRRLGIPWGAYHYFQPTMNPTKQAENFIDFLMGEDPGLGIWGDFEQKSSTDVSLSAQTFMNEIKKYYPSGIYTSPGYAKYTLKNAAWMKEFPLWVAHYGAKTPTIPAPWTEAVLWQYTSTGSGYGSQGFIDLNKFMRPDEEWAAFSGEQDVPVVEPPVSDTDSEKLKKVFAWMEENVKGF